MLSIPSRIGEVQRRVLPRYPLSFYFSFPCVGGEHWRARLPPPCAEPLSTRSVVGWPGVNDETTSRAPPHAHSTPLPPPQGSGRRKHSQVRSREASP